MHIHDFALSQLLSDFNLIFNMSDVGMSISNLFGSSIMKIPCVIRFCNSACITCLCTSKLILSFSFDPITDFSLHDSGINVLDHCTTTTDNFLPLFFEQDQPIHFHQNVDCLVLL